MSYIIFAVRETPDMLFSVNFNILFILYEEGLDKEELKCKMLEIQVPKDVLRR